MGSEDGIFSKKETDVEHVQDEEADDAPPSPLMIVPYIPGLTERVRRILRGRVKVIPSTKPLRRLFHSPKDPLLPRERSCVVYEYTCPDCKNLYIGQTKRPQCERETNHRDDIKHQRTQSCGIANHVFTTGHNVDFSSIRQWTSFSSDAKRKYHEALFIQILDPKLNLNKGKVIDPSWVGLCRREIMRMVTVHP